MASGIGTIANLQGKVNADNELVVSATVSASGGAIADGVTASLKATVLDLTSANPLTVAVTDGNGDQITSFGGGTQYAQGTASTDTDTATMAGVVRKDTPAAATGVADGDRTLASVDSTGQLWTRARQQVDGDTGAGTAPTDIVIAGLAASGGPVSIAGGAGAVSAQVPRMTLASDDPAVASLAILDDWDESDRAKVNPIVGQAGVQGASGVVTALTQRVVLATDVALPALTGGGVAHDSADSGNPHKVGAKAYSPDGTTPGTAVAEEDRTDLKADLDGRLLVSGDHPRSLHKHLNGSTAYTDESIAADPGDGFQIIVTNIIASTGAETALNFFLEEGASTIFGPIYLEAVDGRGFASGPIRLPITASTALTLTSSASIAQSFDIDYYIQAV